MMTTLISSLVLTFGQRDLAYRGPNWATKMHADFGFSYQTGFKYDEDGFSIFSLQFHRNGKPPIGCSIRVRGREFDDREPGFGTRGVNAGMSISNSFFRKQPKIAPTMPFFGDDVVIAPKKNGFQLLQVGYFRKFSIQYFDIPTLARPPKGVPTIDRDRTLDKRVFEHICRLALACSTGDLDLTQTTFTNIDTHSYQCWNYRSIPALYSNAMSRPTTRWIKLSDWARNHHVAVTYGDMTAEYVYRGERYLLPLASDQFKKGTAWFKTSGPILMRGDDWLIPTAMVD
jgi:hypothetical protein